MTHSTTLAIPTPNVEALVSAANTVNHLPYLTKLGYLSTNQKKACQHLVNVHKLSDRAAKAIVAVLTGESLMNPSDFHWDVSHYAQGIASWSDVRSEAISKQFGKYPVYLTLEEQIDAVLWEIENNRAFKLVKKSISGGQPLDIIQNMVQHFEIPGNVSGQIIVRTGIYTTLIPQNLA